MVVFRPPKGRERLDCGDNRVAPYTLGGYLLDRLLRLLFLLGVAIKDDRPIIRALIRSLAIKSGWVPYGQEHPQELAVGNDFGIVGDIDRFRVARAARLDIIIAWVWLSAAGVARVDLLHATKLLKDRFHAPEASGCECGPLHAGWRRAGLRLGLLGPGRSYCVHRGKNQYCERDEG